MRFVLTVDLVDDARRIAAYRRHHRRIWPEVKRSLLRVGVRRLDIYALGRRLMMILEARDGFDLEKSFDAHARSHPRCGEWEALMKTFQVPPPGAKRGRLWTEMEKVFELRPARASRAAPRRPRAR